MKKAFSYRVGKRIKFPTSLYKVCPHKYAYLWVYTRDAMATIKNHFIVNILSV